MVGLAGDCEAVVEVGGGRVVGVRALGAPAGEEVEGSTLPALVGGVPGLAGLLAMLDYREDSLSEALRLGRRDEPVRDPPVQPSPDRLLEQPLRGDADVVVNE